MYELREGYNVQMKPLSNLMSEAYREAMYAWMQIPGQHTILVICDDLDHAKEVGETVSRLYSSFWGPIKVRCVDADLNDFSSNVRDDIYGSLNEEGVRKMLSATGLKTSRYWLVITDDR